MPSAPTIVSNSLRSKEAGKSEAKSEIKWFDQAKPDATPEAGFIITGDSARGVYSWMQFNGAVQPIVKGRKTIVLRLGQENAEIQYPEAFPIDSFLESLRTQRFQRIHHKAEDNLLIAFIEPDDEEES